MNTTAAERDGAHRPGPGAEGPSWLRWLAIAGLCLAIWGGLALVWPWWERHRALEIVGRHFDWDEKEKAAEVRWESKGDGPVALKELDARLVRALRVLGTRRLDISGCAGISRFAELAGVVSLRDARIMSCTGLTAVTGLPTGVEVLYLSGSTGLTSVAGVPAGVQELALVDCIGLTSVQGLPDGVQTLYMGGCTGVSNVAGLPAGLRLLTLECCTGLTRVTGLPAGLRELVLSACTNLTSVEELPPGLRNMDLSKCTELERVGPLPQGLNEVYLADTPKLPEAVKAEIRALVKKNGGTVEE